MRDAYVLSLMAEGRRYTPARFPPARLARARRDAFAALEDLRGPDGTLSRSLTIACTTGRKAEH